jgi:hypothetical protein
MVLDMAALAPDAEADEMVLDMAALAPEAEADEMVLEMAALAPEAEADEMVLEMAALAPEAEADEMVLDMAALAPEAEAEEAFFDVSMLAPDMPTLASDQGAPAGDDPMKDDPDEVVIDLDALRPGPTASGAHDDEGDAAPAADEHLTSEDPNDKRDPDEDDMQVPLHTRTLAELYVKQGAVDRALAVLRHLRDRDPRDHDLARRISELESGVVEPAPLPPLPPRRTEEATADRPSAARPTAGEPEEEVETLARDLAHSGREGHEVQSPFAWGESAAEEPPVGPTIRDYFEGMLEWEPEERT